MDKLYFIIPTINGEIDGLPFIYVSECLVDYVKANMEATIYEISLKTLNVKEVED